MIEHIYGRPALREILWLWKAKGSTTLKVGKNAPNRTTVEECKKIHSDLSIHA